MFRALGLVGIVVVPERHDITFEVDGARLAQRKFVACFVANMECSQDGGTNRAGVCQPLFAVAVRHAVEFRAGVVLNNDRPPPVDHLVLDIHGTGRCRMDSDLVA